MPTPPPERGETVADDDATIKKIMKLDGDEEQLEPGFEDRRPAVFRSTFWEVMCVASLVCGQLTNVLVYLFVALTLGTGSCPTNHYSGLDQILSFNNWSTGLGERCSRNSRRLLPPVVWQIGGHFWSEAGSLGLSYVACRWWSCMWSQRTYVRNRFESSDIRYVFYLGRTLQGLACAGFIPAGIGILAALYYPGRRKNRVFSAFSAAQPLGGGIGGMYLRFVKLV
jgi:hypothetical protein